MSALTDRFAGLKQAIQTTLDAIADSRQRVEEISRSALEEVERLQAEYEQLRVECLQAIEKVEQLEKASRLARERLMQVNRDLRGSSEIDMKSAYETAQSVQMELGQWRERETQLRIRRDEVGRRLKALRATANQAEVVLSKFNHTEQFLNTEFLDASAVLQDAHVHSIIGLQMLQMQEEERRWLAAQLHDGPMQSLASIGMRMQKPGEETSQEVRTRLNSVINDLRQVVFDLRPPLLDDLGLVPTLKRYLQQWSTTHEMTVRIHLLGLEATLSPTEKVTVFRGVQEAVKNAALHSHGDTVDVTLLYTGRELRVQVVDNGVGMAEVNWMDWLEHGKLGLTLCRQRLSLLGGTVQIEANEPHGTKVVMVLPIQRGSDAKE